MSDPKILYSFHNLQVRSYRDLQQLAKSLGLPSNVKKVYLIKLIHAKMFKSAAEVETIVEKVKLERKLRSLRKKQVYYNIRYSRKQQDLQGTEISSTSSSQSPPLGRTPKRPISRTSPDIFHSNYDYPQQSLLRSSTTSLKHNVTPKNCVGSDRVLRSFNVRQPKPNKNNIWQIIRYQKPQRRIVHQKFKSNEELAQQARISIVREGVYSNVSGQCMVKKQYQLTDSVVKECNKHMMPRPNPTLNPRTLSANCPRAPSGMCSIPLNEHLQMPSNEYMKSIDFRRGDGTISKLNALNKEPHTQKQYRSFEMTVQDLIDSNINSQTSNVPHINNISQKSSIVNLITYNQSRAENLCERHSNRNYREMDSKSSVYFHKKIRNEQLRMQRRISFQSDMRPIIDQERLPRINEVFSKFRDVTQPIFVQVSGESERLHNTPIFISKASNTQMMENLWNFKNQFLVNQPLVQIASTALTKCVYSTPIIATPVVQETTGLYEDSYYAHSYGRDSQYMADADKYRYSDRPRMSEFEINAKHYGNYSMEDFSPSTSSLEHSSQMMVDRLSPATIPEMVEDALEIISQDGDYMERIALEGHMQCVLCDWTGTRDALDQHVRKDHPNDIHKQTKSDFNITYTLGSLVKDKTWLNKIIEYDSVLYVLSAKYENPDYFLTSLMTLSPEFAPKIGTVTIYNKVSGEPYSWVGEIDSMPPSFPYYMEKVCLKLEMSKLNLLPNSANLIFHNGELVIKSLNKVIIGQELNDIHIILFVKILN